MIDVSEIDYGKLDRPEIVRFLFHPRTERETSVRRSETLEIMIPSQDGMLIGGRFHMAVKSSPNILFFHGNGEIVADYDDLGPLYNRMGIGFLAVDYRGYGRSTGHPSNTSMMRDAHTVFSFTERWLRNYGYPGPLIVMGRSLGSASALEIAACYSTQIDGLIIESGFARTGPLLRLLGFDMAEAGLTEEDGFRNLDKVKSFSKPTLVIHAERDHLIPLTEGQMLYTASPAREKHLLVIPEADHNDIFMRGLDEYLGAINHLAHELCGGTENTST